MGMYDTKEKLRIDFASLCARHGIRVAQPGDRHFRGGVWTSLKCPFCSGQEGNHLAFNSESNVFTCFRCGRHGKFKTLSALLGVTLKQAGKIAEEFALSVWQVKENESVRLREIADKPEEEVEFILPGKLKMPQQHREYLEGRKFNADLIAKKWGLRFCGAVGRYAYRIIIPITYNGQVVSFTTRDVTDLAQDRYLACPPDEAIRHHKHCVYGLDMVKGDTCVVVEGTPGVWRIGEGAVGTLGTGWTNEQAVLIAKKCKKSFIFFDPDEREALNRAEALSEALSSYRHHQSYVCKGTKAKGRDTGELNKKELLKIRGLLGR